MIEIQRALISSILFFEIPKFFSLIDFLSTFIGYAQDSLIQIIFFFVSVQFFCLFAFLDCLFRRVILYRQVNNKPHVQIKPTKYHAKSYAAYRGMNLKKPMTEVVR